MGIPVNYVRVLQEEREKVCSKSTPLGLMWTDGKRNLLEIIRMVENENAVPVTNIKNYISYFTALANYGYLENRYKVVLHKEDIKKALRRIGVKRNDVVFMHSSLSSAGHIEGGANAVIGALMEVLGPGGTLVMPTNYDNGVIAVTECGLNNPYRAAPPHIPVPWDPAESPTYTGAIPNVFWQRNDVLRSKHPTHSVAVWGKLAEEFIKGHEPGTSGCGREGPYGKMVDYDGKLLYFACSINSTTFWHALEDWLDLPYLPTADVLMKLDDRVVVVKAPKYPEGHRSFYASIPHKISKQMEETGVELKQVPLGLSDLKLVRARDFYDELFPVLQKEADLFLCDREGCPFCTWARKQIASEGRWPMKIGTQTGGNDSEE